MRTVLVDTTVLYAAGNDRATFHEEARSIVSGADTGDLPSLRIPDPIAVETMNGLCRDVGPETATDVLDRLRRGGRFTVAREPGTVWTDGVTIFERVDRLSLADAILVAAARHHDIGYCYSFDSDFDGCQGLTRLTTRNDPFSDTGPRG
jgi:predicted nucleic acid-binding protein